MAEETTAQKIKRSPWKKKHIMELFQGMHKVKFSEKMRHNDWDEKEISVLKKNHVIS